MNTMSDILHTIQMPEATSSELLAAALAHILNGDRVQILVARGEGINTINKLRVALSRTRKRNIQRGRKIHRFTMNHSIYPYTDGIGTRLDAVVLSIKKNRIHRALELADDMMVRESNGGIANVAG